MKPSELKRGYWVCNEDSFLKCYDDFESAKEHIEYQNKLHNNNDFFIIEIKDYSFINLRKYIKL